ncbi:hypothetical protein C5L14_19715 [Labrys okinawensis]|uniref:Uncharacterized protein n=1 Tax=Labrys okinawensis TaxID=346911 RepID=A0A2S9Q8V2_9HYPH|nr:DUF2384 domain-containing protein [Labrys okinawensis]PRH85783.1 hypothetical protein C5L14_19715 [Labrys okinawensis]
MTTAQALKALSGVTTITGTPEEVRDGLGHLGAKGTQVIAVTLDQVSSPAVKALAHTFEAIAPLVGAIVARREKAALQSIIEALVPQVPLPQHMLAEARMTAEARKAVLEEGEWLTAAQIAEVAGFSATNPSAQPNKWKKDGQIFAIRHQGVDYFPGYGLDPATGYRPAKPLAEVLKIFGQSKDGWGAAYWFASDNSYLGGERPLDLLLREPDRVIAAARDEMEGVLHG